MDDASVLGAFRDYQRARGLSGTTIYCYSALHRAFCEWLVGRGLTLTTVTRDDIAAWLDDSPALCNRSRALYIARVHSLFRYMVDEELRPDLPTARLPRPKVPRTMPRPLPTAGMHRALETADPRTRLMLTLACYAGLRRSEIAHLDRASVLDEAEPPCLLVRGKGDKERVVPAGRVLMDAFHVYGMPIRGPIFPGRFGGYISPKAVGEAVSGHLRACGVDGTTHMGRHWFATSLYRGTRDLRLVQDVMGHSNPSTTAAYAARSNDLAASAIASLPEPA